MARTVLVIGAGATIAEHVDRCGDPAARPPLDGDFFTRLSELGSSVHTRPCLAARLQRYMQVPDIKQESMEDVFGTLWADSPRGGGSLVRETRDERDRHPAALFDDLVTGYALMLALTTNHLVENIVEGAVFRVVQRLFEASAGDLTLISFNQDIVADAALYALGQARRTPWDLQAGYSLPFERATNQYRSPEEPDVFRSYDRNALGVDLLKLHGSANWHVEVPFENAKIDEASNEIVPIEPEEGFPLPNLRSQFLAPRDARVLCVQNRHLADTTPITFDTRRRLVKVLPIVVPPVFEKGEWIEGWLAPAWQRARDALRRADHLVLWGYSLPAADHRAYLLFRRSLAGREQLPRVSLVNPDIRLARRYWEALGLSSLEQYRSQDNLLAAL